MKCNMLHQKKFSVIAQYRSIPSMDLTASLLLFWFRFHTCFQSKQVLYYVMPNIIERYDFAFLSSQNQIEQYNCPVKILSVNFSSYI